MKLKTFIYVKESKPTIYSNRLTFKVYRVKKNLPIYIGEVTASGGAYKGDDSTVMCYLSSKGCIGKKHNGYYSPKPETDGFQIYQVG